MWRPENWPDVKLRATMDLLKRIKPKKKPTGEQWVEEGADTMHKADVEWLKDKSKQTIVAYNKGELLSSYTMLIIPEEDWQRFSGE